MTEAEAAPGPGPGNSGTPEVAPEVTPPEAPRRSPRALPAWLGVIAFLILAAGIIVVWLHPRMPVSSDQAALAQFSTRLEQLSAGLHATETRLAAAEATLSHLPPRPDLGPIEARLSALEKRPTPAPAPLSHPAPLPQPAPSAQTPSPAEFDAALAPLSARLDGLETSEATLKKNVTAIEQKLSAAAPLTERLDGLEKSEAALKQNLAALERKLAVTAAAVALAEGRPLGDLTGAPPALARFATTSPPTLAGLRASFGEAASAERAAARPSGSGEPLTKRFMNRLGDLLTVREGNQVIIGNPAEPALTSAQAALASGDLAGAVQALAGLPGQKAPAMVQWEDQAKALLAARAAIAHIAGID
ncbi:MAG: COG4223 family protein [Acetobacteraceae bacterium]